MSKKGLIILGCVSFFTFLMIKLPAAVAYKLFAPENVQMSGVQGTLWHGESAAVVVNGDNLGSLKWDLSVWRLLTLKLAADIELERPDSSFAQGMVAAGLGGTVSVKDFRALVNTAVLNIPALSFVTADLGLNLQSASFEQGWPAALNGTINIANLQANQANAMLGNFSVTFTEQNNVPLVGQFTDERATLGAKGSLTLDSDRRYAIEGNLTPTGATNANVRNALRFMGQPSSDGSVAINTQGTL